MVVVLANGAPVEMPWRDRVAAILEGYLGGQAGGSAIADVLTGAAEPGGRLAETFPARWEDHPLHGVPIGPRVSSTARACTSATGSPAPARRSRSGTASSYTTFSWSALEVDDASVADDDGLAVTARLTVTNTGDRAGSDVVQLYVHDPESTAFRPEHELRAFAKVPPGAGRIRGGRPRARPPRVRVLGPGPPRLGGGARGVRAPRRRLGARHPRDRDGRGHRRRRDGRAVGARRAAGPVPPASRGAFAALLDRALPENVPDAPGEYTRNTPLADMRRSPVVLALIAALRRGGITGGCGKRISGSVVARNHGRRSRLWLWAEDR